MTLIDDFAESVCRGRAEHQATGALPQSADNTGSAGYHLVERTQEN